MSAFQSPGLDRLQRRRTIRRVVLIGALLLVLLLSALLWPQQRTDALTVPTTARAVPAAGVLTGSLTAVRTGDRVCFAVRTDDGPAPIVLPRGWAADDSLGLLDPSGVVVAQPGATVRATGDPGPTGSAPGCAQRGRVWTVGEVWIPPGV